MITIKCKKCGKKIKTYPSRIGRKNYCSKQCQWSGHSVIKKCKTCKKLFKVWKKTDSIGQGIYCSRDCRKEDKNVKRICLICGKEFLLWKSNEKRNKGKLCSRECQTKYKETLTRELSNQWLGGTSGEVRLRLGTKKWKTIREIARKRDNYTCQYCGKGGVIHIHHLIPFRISQDNSLENLITLCESCHHKSDHKYNRLVK